MQSAHVLNIFFIFEQVIFKESIITDNHCVTWHFYLSKDFIIKTVESIPVCNIAHMLI